jgi:hypothetical protein
MARGLRNIVENLRQRAGGGASAPLYLRADRARGVGYDQTIAEARAALRAGKITAAEDALMRAAPLAGEDEPDFFNLLGLLHESRCRWKSARKAYGRAISGNRKYLPAQQNMKRLYELNTFGHTWQAPAFGDEPNFSDAVSETPPNAQGS